MYHGVSSVPAREGLRDSAGKHLPVDLFARHLSVLKRSRQVIPLQEMVRGLRDRQDMDNTVALTFDDGYENNVLVAAPALADAGMSASFFVTTGIINTDTFIWTDRVEMIVDRASGASIRLAGDGEEFPIGSLEEKRRALTAIKSSLKRLDNELRTDALEHLAIEHGVADACAEGDYRFMTWDQVRGLVAAGFEVGAHTVTHPILTRLPLAEAADEILGSKEKVLQETGKCSETFCFPNGKSTDFNGELQALCRQHFGAALSTNRGAAMLDELYELRRLSPAGTGSGEDIEWMLLRAQ